MQPTSSAKIPFFAGNVISADMKLRPDEHDDHNGPKDSNCSIFSDISKLSHISGISVDSEYLYKRQDYVQSANEKRQTNLEKFLNETLETMNSNIVDWRTLLNDINGETIYVSNVLDFSVGIPQLVEGSAHDRRYRGCKGEAAVFEKFQSLKLGGILIHGFDSSLFAKKVGMQQKMKKKRSRHFECDFIFIHQRIGIVIIEVKACIDTKKIGDVYKRAVQQLDRMQPGLKAFYKRICQNQRFTLPIKSVVWFPFSTYEDKDYNDSIICIDQAKSINKNELRGIFMNIMLTKWTTEEELIQFHRFACALVAYRSVSVIPFTSSAIHAQMLLEKQPFEITSLHRKERLRMIKQAPQKYFNRAQNEPVENSCYGKMFKISSINSNTSTKSN